MNKNKKVVKIGSVLIGGDNPVTVQSMLKTHPANLQEATSQIHRLQDSGCELIRIAVPDMEGAYAFSELKKESKVPIIADIHFDYRLALEVIKRGVDKIRLNPSNIKNKENIKRVVLLAKERDIPIRVGANFGSIKKEKENDNVVDLLFEDIKREIDILESLDFDNIVVSAKCSDIDINYRINKKLFENYNYPIHVGITEAGTLIHGIVKSSIGLYGLISEGIGNTLRISLSGELENEVKAAISILKCMNKHTGVEIISCPTCGRSHIDVKKYADLIEKETIFLKKKIKIAVMGCEVNGPGEAKDADIGIAGCGNYMVLFENGEVVEKGKPEEIIDILLRKILN
jgi:(E)-4-hydroxy-3-methylbut-2-enyl-diphosphate synthase